LARCLAIIPRACAFMKKINLSLSIFIIDATHV
jgi:hypothetical protein